MYVVDQLNDLRICFFFSYIFELFFPNFSFLIIHAKPFVGRSVGCELATRTIFKQINKRKILLLLPQKK